MQKRCVPYLVAAVVVGLVLVGCEPAPPPVPMPTTGPNQVVIVVPGMT